MLRCAERRKSSPVPLMFLPRKDRVSTSGKAAQRSPELDVEVGKTDFSFNSGPAGEDGRELDPQRRGARPSPGAKQGDHGAG